MPECPGPHNSAQGSSYLPGLVALNQTLISRPGTASCFKRNDGTKKLWMTSLLRSTTLTTLFTGTCSSLSAPCRSLSVLSSAVSNTLSGPGYAKPHANWLAVTRTCTSGGGTFALMSAQVVLLTNQMPTNTIAGMIVQVSSNAVLPCV